MAASEAPTPLQQLLDVHGACREARAWAMPYRTAGRAWAACRNPQWMLWVLRKIGENDDRRMRLAVCAFVRRTPLADGRMVWDLLTDQRSRAAVEVAERFAEGEATAEELKTAEAAAARAAGAAWAAAATAEAEAAAWAQCDEIRRIWGNPLTAARVAKLLKSKGVGRGE